MTSWHPHPEPDRVVNGEAARHDAPDEPGALSALGAVLLVAALVFAVLGRLRDPAGEARAAIRQAAALLAQGRYSEAAGAYEAVLTGYNAPEVRLGLSYAYLARLDIARSERQARAALEIAGPDLQPATWSQLGRVLAVQGKEADALEAWSHAGEAARPFSEAPPVEAEARSARWHRAMLEWSHGDFRAAGAQLEALVGGSDIYAASARVKLAQLHAPEDSDISRKLLAELREPTGAQLGPGAIMSLDPATGAAIPDLRVPRVAEGLSLDALRSAGTQLQLAWRGAEQTRQAGAGEGSLAAFWGRAFLQQGEPYLARTYLERAVAASPGLSDAHTYLGLAMIGTGNVAGALPHLARAIALDPGRPLPRYVLAGQLIARSDWDRASEQLSAIKALEPDTLQMHLQLAEYYAARGAYDLAEDEYLKAYNKQHGSSARPGEVDAALTLSRFYTDVRGEGCDKGLPAAKESEARHPGDPASLDAVGWSLVQCGRAEEALSALENAVRTAPEVARFRFHLGKAYAQLKRADDAREQYSRAIDLDPRGQWERLAVAGIAALGAG